MASDRSEDLGVLRDRAAAVLRGNDAGGWTKASPHLYPHQWSWDSAFNAIGWAHLDVRRAMAELEGLFAAQWTTGICQPPVHALALQRIWQLTPPAHQPEIRARLRALYPRLVSWHRYLAT